MTLRVPDHVSFSRVEGDFVLMDVAGGRYFALDPVASRLWERIVAGAEAEQLVQDLVRDYHIDSERAQRDVDDLIADLLAKGLLTRAE